MFTSGLKKTAAFDHSSQGLEFKTSDMSSGNVGPGGMAPSGIPSYQPVEDNAKGGQKTSRKARARAAVQMMYKMSGSDIASGTVDQLKWTSQNGPDLETEAADRQELKTKRRGYLRARVRE